MARALKSGPEQASSFATHNLHVSPVFFSSLCKAIHVLSVREHDLYSFRRLVAKILKDPEKALYRINISTLEDICQTGRVVGRISLPLRIDTATNDLLRDFREHAEMRLGRPVSVSEALSVCFHAVSASN